MSLPFLRSEPTDAERAAYRRFRLGLSFADVRAELKAEQDAAYRSGRYMFVSRSTVLGRMRQYKLEAWEAYRRELERQRAEARRRSEEARREGLPF